jgi:hypothetical protein
MPLSLKLNRALLFVFTTLWAVAYYVVYFRNPVYLWVIVVAVALDATRLSPTASSRLYAIFTANKHAIFAVIAGLFALHCWLVVSDKLPEIAFGLPYDHYRTVLETVSKIHAAIIYCLEAAGAVASFVIIAFNGIQMATAQTSSFLDQTNRLLKKVSPRAGMRKLIWLFVGAYTLQLSVGIITVRIHGRAGPYDYHPEWDPFDLAMFVASPIFFALGVKYWLRAVVAYLKQVESNAFGRSS